jgi:lipoprotein-anchoring transpeptidase ErfK/SrfK
VVNFSRTGVATDLVQKRLAMSIRPRPKATVPFRHIEVIKSKQVALLISRKGIVRRTVHVSTAKPGWSTPVGHFQIYSKARMSWSRPFHVWLPWASYVVGGIAFHSYPSVPTYPASHGCIRVPAPEAVMLYRFATLGTKTWIRR